MYKKKYCMQKVLVGQYFHTSFQMRQHSALRKQTKPSNIKTQTDNSDKMKGNGGKTKRW